MLLFILRWSCFIFENMKISSFKQLKYDILLWRLDILGQPPTRMVFFISNSQNHLLLFEIIYYALILQQPNLVSLAIQIVLLIIGAESGHWLCLSLTPLLTRWLTDCHLVNLIDVTLACERWQLKTCWSCYCCRCWWWGSCWQHFVADLEAEVWSQNTKLNFCSDFDHKVWSRFWHWSTGEILKLKFISILLLMFGWGCKAELGQD